MPPTTQRVTIEFGQLHVACRHPELRVEILVAGKQRQIVREPSREYAIGPFHVEAAQLTRDVGIDSGEPPDGVIQHIGVADEHVGVLRAALESIRG